jgi:hypothetical protein
MISGQRKPGHDAGGNGRGQQQHEFPNGGKERAGSRDRQGCGDCACSARAKQRFGGMYSNFDQSRDYTETVCTSTVRRANALDDDGNLSPARAGFLLSARAGCWSRRPVMKESLVNRLGRTGRRVELR